MSMRDVILINKYLLNNDMDFFLDLSLLPISKSMPNLISESMPNPVFEFVSTFISELVHENFDSVIENVRLNKASSRKKVIVLKLIQV